jgi:putative transposase
VPKTNEDENLSRRFDQKPVAVLENLLDPNQRKRKYCLRDIMNALLYIAKSGIQWRMLPNNYSPWESAYYYFRKWKREGLIEEINDILV